MGGGGWVGGQRKIRHFERDLRSKITIEHPLLSHLGAPATPAAPAAPAAPRRSTLPSWTLGAPAAPAAQARRRGQKLLRPGAYQQIISGKISFRPYAVF